MKRVYTGRRRASQTVSVFAGVPSGPAKPKVPITSPTAPSRVEAPTVVSAPAQESKSTVDSALDWLASGIPSLPSFSIPQGASSLLSFGGSTSVVPTNTAPEDRKKAPSAHDAVITQSKTERAELIALNADIPIIQSVAEVSSVEPQTTDSASILGGLRLGVSSLVERFTTSQGSQTTMLTNPVPSDEASKPSPHSQALSGHRSLPLHRSDPAIDLADSKQALVAALKVLRESSSSVQGSAFMKAEELVDRLGGDGASIAASEFMTDRLRVLDERLQFVRGRSNLERRMRHEARSRQISEFVGETLDVRDAAEVTEQRDSPWSEPSRRLPDEEQEEVIFINESAQSQVPSMMPRDLGGASEQFVVERGTGFKADCHDELLFARPLDLAPRPRGSPVVKNYALPAPVHADNENDGTTNRGRTVASTLAPPSIRKSAWKSRCDSCGELIRNKDFKDLFEEEECRIWNQCFRCLRLVFRTLHSQRHIESAISSREVHIGNSFKDAFWELHPKALLPIRTPAALNTGDTRPVYSLFISPYHYFVYLLCFEFRFEVGPLLTARSHVEIDRFLTARGSSLTPVTADSFAEKRLSLLRKSIFIVFDQHPLLGQLLQSIPKVSIFFAPDEESDIDTTLFGVSNDVGSVWMELLDSLTNSRTRAAA